MRSVFVSFPCQRRFVKTVRLVAGILALLAPTRELQAQSLAFSQQPQGGTRYPGDGFLLSCVITGAPSITYQWYQNASLLAGATSSQLFLSNLTLAGAGNYSVVAADGASSITSAPASLAVLSDTNITGTIQDIRHVVIFMEENRSFDAYIGSLEGVRGFNDRNALLWTNGNTVFFQPGNGSYVLPFHVTAECLEDDAHSWDNEHSVWDSGKWDQWVAVEGTTAMSYYTRDDLPYLYALAESYTVCDAYYCSVLTSTYPNRLFLMTGMNDPNGTGGGPVTANNVPPGGYTWTTYPELLQAAGVSWKVYQQSSDFYPLNALSWFAQYMNAPTGSALYVNGQVLVNDLVSAFQSDVASGTLARVSWIIPPWSESEHPPFSPANGDVLTKQLLDALASNPAVYNSTVFILVYDEAGGYFDHVPPPVPPPGTANEFVGGEPIGLGARVPTVLVSPWTRGGYVCSQVFDHTSILRFLETWTGVSEPNISAWRRQVCGDLTSAFNFVSPNTNYPSLPSPTNDECSSGLALSPPSPQSMPVQEAGTLTARLLPYQPNAGSAADCVDGWLSIAMTNAGAESVHFMIFANAYRTDGPWQYDVGATNSVSDNFSVLASNGGLYDLTCYGPNGFQRRFAGTLYTNCGLVEVTSGIDPNGGVLTVAMQNLTASTVVFTVTNEYPTGGPWTYNVPAGTIVTDTFPVVANNSGWYDLTATASNDSLFVRRLAGHIEPTDFSLLVTPTAQSVTNGSSATCTVTLGAIGGFNGIVTLSVTGLPANVSAGFSPAAVTGSGTSTLSMVISNGAAPGNYPLTVVGTSSNSTHTATTTLTIEATDFSLLVTPTAQSVTNGSNATCTVTLGAINGFNGIVTLSVTGLPASVSAGFSPAAVTGSGTSTLSMVISNCAAPGDYPLTVIGTSTDSMHTAAITLTINLLDSDCDGIPDGWMQQYFGSPTGMVSNLSMPWQDADGTGQNNFFKYVAGLDPTNPASVFVLNTVSVFSQPQWQNLFFSPVAGGRTYTPQFSTDLVNGVWMPLTTYMGPVTNNVNQVTITNTNPIPPQEFYRLSISMP